jgi:uncharacterized protein YqeY
LTAPLFTQTANVDWELRTYELTPSVPSLWSAMVELPRNYVPATKEAEVSRIESSPESERDPIMGLIASLAAAISLLERTPKAKKAAPSDTMFEMMLSDYRKALEAGRRFAQKQRDGLAQSSREAREIVTEWMGMFDPPPQIDFQQSEFLQQSIASALAAPPPSTQKVSECPIGMTDPAICSAGSCQRCSDWRDGWNAAISTKPGDQ